MRINNWENDERISAPIKHEDGTGEENSSMSDPRFKEKLAELIAERPFALGGVRGFSLVIENFIKSKDQPPSIEERMIWHRNVSEIGEFIINGNTENEVQTTHFYTALQFVASGIPDDMDENEKKELEKLLEFTEKINRQTKALMNRPNDLLPMKKAYWKDSVRERMARFSGYLFEKAPFIIEEINNFNLIATYLMGFQEGKPHEGDQEIWEESTAELITMLREANIISGQSRREISDRLLSLMSNILMFMPKNPDLRDMEALHTISTTVCEVREKAMRVMGTAQGHIRN